MILLICLVYACDSGDPSFGAIEPTSFPLVQNPYLPLDPNDLYIYQYLYHYYDDVAGDSVEDTTITSIDTLIATQEDTFMGYGYSNLFELNFHTKADKVVLLLEEQNMFGDIYKMDFLFTSRRDTGWAYYQDHPIGFPSTVSFAQRGGQDTLGQAIPDELVLQIYQNLTSIGLPSYDVTIRFKKEVGIINFQNRSNFHDESFELIEYIDR